MKTKTYDCIEAKRAAAAEVLKEIGGMTLEQQLAYWQKHTRALRERQQQVQADRKG